MQKATGHIRTRKRKDGQKAFQIIAELPPDPLTGKRQRKYLTIIGTKKEAEKALHKLIRDPGTCSKDYASAVTSRIATW